MPKSLVKRVAMLLRGVHLTLLDPFAGGGSIPFELKIRVTAGCAKAGEAKNHFSGSCQWLKAEDMIFFTDLDFYLDQKPSKEDIIKLCHHASEKAPQVHTNMMKKLGY